MSEKMKYMPAEFHSVTPYLILREAARAIEFYKQVFEATELSRQINPASGRIRHAQIKIGDSALMLVEESPDYPEMRSVQAHGGSPIHIYLYVEKVDAVFERAIAAGATEVMSVQDHDYGDRSGGIVDPFGLTWWIATHIGE